MSRFMKTVLAVAVTSAVLAAPAAAQWQHFASPAPAAHVPTTQELLRQAKQAFRPGGPPTDLTPLLKQLAARLPSLHGNERRQAQSLLARPTDGSADPQGSGYTVPEAPPFCSAHYCVHWVASTDDAPAPTDSNTNGVPDYVETVDAVAENSYAVENDQLGWRAPKSDGTLGGDSGKTDIYLKQLGGSGIYGYAAPDPGQPRESDHSLYAYLVIDNDFQKSEFPSYTTPLTPLEVTLAHEYNHILQFRYDSLQDTWMFESTAVWMEGKVYPDAFDYLQYLPGWVRLTALPLTTFNSTDPNDRGNVKVYGTAVWNKWLDAQYGADVVRRAWEVSLDTKPPSYAVGAYDRAIREKGPGGFALQFSRFAAATAEWQAQNSGFPEGARYPDVTRAGTARVNGPGGIVKLNHTTYALVDVPVTSAPRVKLGMTAPSGTNAALALVGRTGGLPGGDATVELKTLPHGGRGSVIIDNPSRFSRLTAVLINADARVTGGSPITGDWIYGRDNQQYYARATTDFTAPRVVRSSPRAGAKRVSLRTRVKVTFSEPVLGVDTRSLQLLAPGGRKVGARVKFTPGSRVATLTPNNALGRARRYKVRVTNAVTDTAVNPLARTATWAFVTAR